MVAGGKSKSNFELNLVPFIDILSTCICFLLMTTMWINLKGLSTQQAVGSEADPATAEAPLIEAEFSDSGDLNFRLKNSPELAKKIPDFNAGNMTSEGDWLRVKNYLLVVKRESPELSAAIIMPKGNSRYEDLMGLMGQFKDQQIVKVGIAPL